MEQEKKKLELMVMESSEIIVNNQEDYGYAVEQLNLIKDFRKKLDARYKPIQQKTKEANQLALQNIRDYSVPLDKAKGNIQKSINSYKAKKDAERKAEEDRLRAEAVKKEKKRLTTKVKKMLTKDGLSEEEIKEQVKEQIDNTEIIAPKVEIEDDTKVDGITYREYWEFSVVDFEKLPDEYKKVDESKIRGIVKAMKQNTNIPGVRVYSEKRGY